MRRAVRPSGRDFMEAQRKAPPVARTARKRRFEYPCVPAFHTRRPRDRERPFAPAEEMRIEHEERQAREVIAMEMGDQDDVDVITGDAEPLERDQGGGAAIDQKIRAFAGDVKAGVETPARAERVAATDELDLHLSASVSS